MTEWYLYYITHKQTLYFQTGAFCNKMNYLFITNKILSNKITFTKFV